MIRILISTTCLVVFLVVPCVATINVVVSTYDGIVVAADSRVTLTTATKTRVLSDFGEKIIRVGSHALATFSGNAHLLDNESQLRSISSILNQFKNKSGISDTTLIDPAGFAYDVDTLLNTLYNKQSRNAQRGNLSIVICGIDRDHERRLYQLRFTPTKKIESDTIVVIRVLDTLTQTPQSFVNGQDDVWFRIIKGYDPQLKAHEWFRLVKEIVVDSTDTILGDTIIIDTVDADTVDRVDTLKLDELRYKIRYDLMTLQDAIDFAVFIVRATIEAQRFNQASILSVGGAIDIAVVTPEGFRWVQHKRLHGEGSTELIEK